MLDSPVFDLSDAAATEAFGARLALGQHRQEHRRENADDGDDAKQFNQREADVFALTLGSLHSENTLAKRVPRIQSRNFTFRFCKAREIHNLGLRVWRVESGPAFYYAGARFRKDWALLRGETRE